AADVFTAAEQKHTFEVRKVHIDQQRVLCRACHREWVALEREARDCRRRWSAERPALAGDPEFLRRWLVVLQALPGYNGSRDEAKIVMLRRLSGTFGVPYSPASSRRGGAGAVAPEFT
ncbi:MAG TPA: zinc-ribbon domain containing protein, partial [Gemmataceae bacterium]|nr:zinc-ribbon domain containing protein [Gemmataceae bacterium]